MLPQISHLSPLTNQDWFFPAKFTGFLFKQNIPKIILLGEISIKGEILQKTELEQKLDIQLKWYQYIQLTSFFKQKRIHQVSKAPLTELELILQNFRDPQRGLISKKL